MWTSKELYMKNGSSCTQRPPRHSVYYDSNTESPDEELNIIVLFLVCPSLPKSYRGFSLLEVSERGPDGSCRETRLVLNRCEETHRIEIKREIQRILVHDCRCNERLKDKSEGSTHLTYWGTGTLKDRDEVKRREV